MTAILRKVLNFDLHVRSCSAALWNFDWLIFLAWFSKMVLNQICEVYKSYTIVWRLLVDLRGPPSVCCSGSTWTTTLQPSLPMTPSCAVLVRDPKAVLIVFLDLCCSNTFATLCWTSLCSSSGIMGVLPALETTKLTCVRILVNGSSTTLAVETSKEFCPILL